MFYDFLWSDPDPVPDPNPAKRFGSERIRIRNTANQLSILEEENP